MHDISLAVGLIGFLSVAIFLGLVRVLRSVPRRLLEVIAVGIVLLMAAYVKYIWGQLWIVQWIPLPSAIVLTNWFPLLLGALGAVVWVRLDGEHHAQSAGSESTDTELSAETADHPAVVHSSAGKTGLMIRRLATMGLIIAGAIYSVMHFIPLTVPVCGDQWDPPSIISQWPVCRQTDRDTCSAAAAATILNTLGIAASEQEMARLCLTKRGTTWLGLYHGLSTKLTGSNHRVEFFEAEIDSLPELATPHPLLLCCELNTAAAESAPEYVTDGGWIPGTAHSVVYFGAIRDRHIIGDPSRGYELWRSEDLKVLWTGQGLMIGHIKPEAEEHGSGPSE